MFLGGSTQQITAIQYAKEQGYYTILCDYLKDNPGQSYSDKYFCVSTTDKEAILDVAKRMEIDGIVAFASDPAAATAAYVAQKLNLPSNSLESVLLLSKKDLFRDFLKKHGFNCPNAKSFKSVEEAKKSLSEFQFPLMVKPTDSSGSKGVSRIDSIEELGFAFNDAIANSITKTVIIEEYIEMAHECMNGGDVFVLNGKIEFFGFLNSHRNKEINTYIPIGNSYPMFINGETLIRDELQKLINLLQIDMGAFNIEVMFDKNGKLYFIEIGPRNGGNMIPELLELITGVDLVKATVEVALNNKEISLEYYPSEVFYSTYVLHSSKNGKLKNIVFKEEIQKNIIKKVMFKELKDEVEVFDKSNKLIGIIFLKYSSLNEMKYKMNNMNEFIDIEVLS